MRGLFVAAAVEDSAAQAAVSCSPANSPGPNTELTRLKECHRCLLSVLAAKDNELQRLRRLSTAATVPDHRQGDDAFGAVRARRGIRSAGRFTRSRRGPGGLW
ncbi:hypothetical protein AB852_08890 [Streptomyces uncialis]|uniref:Uncharacterized protein n=1 Tax=Streptomyces uncialis TaxID=1048205 RepID=A0A1Q4V994_9ACTN|nr:hypothetical protein AB852_08890 [Streptomyces uncialis]